MAFAKTEIFVFLSAAVCYNVSELFERRKTMKRTATAKFTALFLVICTLFSLASVTASADINYIDEIHVSYEHRTYKAGDTPTATAAVTSGHCTVAYEYWREIYQKEEGGVWSGTGKYWYSDETKMNALAADKRITKFEAGKTYSYNIVLKTESGYFIGDNTVVFVGDYEWGKAGRHTNLAIKEMSTALYIYSPYSLTVAEDNTDKVITSVSITDVNKNLNAETPVTFTARSAAADKYDITEEAWEPAGEGDIIKSTDSPKKPVAGGEYWYSIVLTAKDGYVFSEDFSDSHHMIKEGSGVTFTLGGEMYDGRFALSEDRKTLTAWEFMDPVTAKSEKTLQPISEVEINGATITFNAGKVPVFSGKTPENAPYEYQCEWWETDGGKTGVASSENSGKNYENPIKTFESGKTYKYGVSVKAADGYCFTADTKLKINGKYYNYNSEDGQVMFAYTDLEITPQASAVTPADTSDNMISFLLIVLLLAVCFTALIIVKKRKASK